MSVVQTWLVVGVPGLVIAAALFAGRSRVRAWLGFVTLAALVGVFVATPGGGVSAAILSIVVVVLVATGRGTYLDGADSEHHQARRRFTTASGDA